MKKLKNFFPEKKFEKIMQELLLKSLENIITKSIEQYIQRIVKHYDNTDRKILLEIWEGEVKETVNTDSSSCPYKATKGKNVGKICGIKLKNGNMYCSTHKKYEGSSVKEKNIVPEPKKKKSVSPPAQRIFRKHKILNNLYHPETDLVIKSNKERMVVGKIVKNKVIKLTEEDIDICKQWGFQYEKEEDSPRSVSLDTEKLIEDLEDTVVKNALGI